MKDIAQLNGKVERLVKAASNAMMANTTLRGKPRRGSLLYKVGFAFCGVLLISTGLLFGADNSSIGEAAWITGAYEAPMADDAPALMEDAPNVILRRDFPVRPVPIVRAELKMAGLGMCDVELNGRRLTETPSGAWTSYDTRVIYDTLDVTEWVRVGETNVLQAVLGNGWWNPLPLKMWGRILFRAHLAHGTPCLKAVLRLAYADGVEECVPTDARWRAAEGPWLRNSIYLGEVYDARRPIVFDRAARKTEGPRGVLTPRDFPSVVIWNRRPAVRVTEPTNGVYVIDFGVNAAGTMRMTFHNCRKGDRVTLRYGEALFSDGTIDTLTTCAGQLKDVSVRKIQVGEQRDVVILPAADTFVYEPRLTYHTFRYVQVEGLSVPPHISDAVALDWCSDVADKLEFACSNQRLEQLLEVIRRTFRSNLMSVQSDCSGRERLCYGGDIAGICEQFFTAFEMGAYYRNLVRNFLDAAGSEGLFTETAPFVGIQQNEVLPGTRCGPMGWTLATPVLLDGLLRHAGDVESVRTAYPTLLRFLDRLDRTYPDGVPPPCLGDYEAVEWADTALTSVAHYYQFASLVAKFGRVLGDRDGAARCAKLSEKIASAFRARFVRDDGRVGKGLQGEQVFALHFGLVPDELRAKAYGILKDDIARHGDALTTGMFATAWMLDLLSRSGDVDLAGRIVMHKGFPGWMHMLDSGATTLWERFVGNDQWHSLNHPLHGGVVAWLAGHVLGIRVCDDAVGMNRVVIDPKPTAGVTWARGSLQTPHGRISVSWWLEDGRVRTKTSVPAGISYDLHPSGQKAQRLFR